MTHKLRSQILALLTLLVLSAQIVAAPLLSCRGMLRSADMTLEEHCARMMMTMEDVQTVSSPASSLSSLLTDSDCASLCQFCRGVNSADVPEPLVLNTPLVLAWTASLLDPLALASPPTDHFRPPTTV